MYIRVKSGLMEGGLKLSKRAMVDLGIENAVGCVGLGLDGMPRIPEILFLTRV